ncbi:hypothetical protein ORI20_21840 [Mycobacterium sp. CVI_P3]|uniref:Uncharacterized protein n=1 Tax=Mycobacterium pinniadriaticum TaxID=2994102 RepID=A0ABT3SKQ6_9MYCO|nr:hypothetical protein [Mycobacterium pinniadriaticum]MCX2932916.1 hypothetical protein [Mycobacterium pinniadriaticum]MCX2939412.1 hypothetical protein [Mycobacterium pinniadriaticum]
MSPIKRGWPAIVVVAALAVGSQLTAAVAQAEPVPAPTPAPTPVSSEQTPVSSEEAGPPVLHNITYRARIDGVSRGATISYAAQDDQTQTANPTMVPGRVFEANTVLPETGQADVRVSIQWPYSANLHCEILVDDALVAQADDFIAPRVLPVKDDPDYGALTCEAPVAGVPNTIPADPAAVPADPAMPDAPPPPVAPVA